MTATLNAAREHNKSLERYANMTGNHLHNKSGVSREDRMGTIMTSGLALTSERSQSFKGQVHLDQAESLAGKTTEGPNSRRGGEVERPSSFSYNVDQALPGHDGGQHHRVSTQRARTKHDLHSYQSIMDIGANQSSCGGQQQASEEGGESLGRQQDLEIDDLKQKYE